MPDSDVSAELPDGCLVRGNPKTFMGPSLVAFVDILGMSRALLEDWGTHHDSALKRLLRIKSSVPRDDAKSQVTITLADRQQDKDIEKYLSVTRTLSDSMVTMMAMPDKCDVETFFLRVHALFITVGLVWRQALREGFTVRGGVDIGPMFWDEDEFTGPGLIWAYNLEKEAASSRILAGPRLLRQIAMTGVPLDNLRNPATALTLGADGKVLIDPHFLLGAEDLTILRHLRTRAMGAQDKYDQLISMLETSRELLPRPSLADLQQAWRRAGLEP